MRKSLLSNIFLGTVLTLLLTQCTMIGKSKMSDHADVLFYTASINEVKNNNISWSFEEAAQTTFFDQTLAGSNEPIRRATRHLSGKYGQSKLRVFLTTYVSQYGNPIRLDEIEKIEFDFTPDITVTPKILEIGKEQKGNCLIRNVNNDQKNGYIACSIQIRLDEEYLYTVYVHGEVDVSIAEDIINDVIVGLQSKLQN
ncbi:MAG: hypothetical protein QM730_23550 [Anaerolineales bacterium]